MAKEVLLIDLSHIFWTLWHATADEELSAAFERTMGTLHKLKSGADHVAVCCDSPPYFRKEILPTYKAQRDAPPPVAIEQLMRVKARCEADGFLLWEVRGFESDDLIATACMSPILGADLITVASNDKDLCQLVTADGRVTVLHPFKSEEFDWMKVIEKFGVPPDLMGDLLALWGDAGDNIPGVPGVGPKTGAKLLMEFGSLEGVLTHTDDIPQPKLRESLVNHGPAARLARRLVSLRHDAPIDVADIYKEREAKPLVETGMEEPLDVMGPEVAPNIVDESAPGRLNAAGDFGGPPPELVKKLAGEQGSTTLAPLPKLEKKATELVTYQGPEFDRGLEPATLDAAWRLAGGILNSRLYTKFTKQEAIWVVIVRGREMGLGAITALDSIHFFENKTALSAHLIVARAKQHPECEYFQMVESTSERARYVCKRRGNPEPTSLTYTIDQARRAGVIRERGNWASRPDEMLRKTCAVQLARVEFPEALLGAYAMEELNPDHGE